MRVKLLGFPSNFIDFNYNRSLKSSKPVSVLLVEVVVVEPEPEAATGLPSSKLIVIADRYDDTDLQARHQSVRKKEISS